MGDVVALAAAAATPLAPTTLPAFPGHSTAFPSHGAVFADPRGEGRTMRVSWHDEERLVVLSFWRGGACTGTFRLAAADLPDLLCALTDGPLGRSGQGRASS